MTVKTPGDLAPVAGDFQTTHKGQVIAIVAIQGVTGDSLAIIKKNSQTQLWDVYFIEEYDDNQTVDKAVKIASGMTNYLKSLLPKINEILLKLFPKSSTTTTPPPSVTYSLAQLDSALATVYVWAPQADGTIKVNSKV